MSLSVYAFTCGWLEGDFARLMEGGQGRMSAQSFDSVPPGTYTLKVYAAVGSGASIMGSGSAVGAAAFGLGSVTAEVVRLVHDFEF